MKLVFCLFAIEHKGRTLHLLKSSSKPVPQQRKRKKISLYGTFEQYKEAQEEQKQEDSHSNLISAPLKDKVEGESNPSGRIEVTMGDNGQI